MVPPWSCDHGGRCLKEKLGESEDTLFPRDAMRHTTRIGELGEIGYIPAIIADECVFVGELWFIAEDPLGFFDRDERIRDGGFVDPFIQG